MRRERATGPRAAPNAIWRFREALTTAGATERLFAWFDAHLRERGYLAMGGQIVDASIVAAPRQRMTAAERETVKGGDIPDEWRDRPAKLRQKDRDARWTVKRGPDGVLMAPIAMPVFDYKRAISPRTGATASSAAAR